MRALWLTVLALACSEYRVQGGDLVPPAEPPGLLPDAQGKPPSDWNRCASGFVGRYYNLGASHPQLSAPAPLQPDDVDWYDSEYLAFSRYDPTLEKGDNWWPVDSGIQGDPAQFAVRWTAWMRARSNTRVSVLLAAADDAWVVVGSELVAEQTDAEVLSAEVFEFDLRPGVYPVDIHYAHRLATSAGFRFRIVSGDVELCYPELPD